MLLLSPCTAIPKAPESSPVGLAVRTVILLLSTTLLFETCVPVAPLEIWMPVALCVIRLCSMRSLLPLISTPAQEQLSASTWRRVRYEPDNTMQLVAPPPTSGRFPVPYASTTIGLALV